MPQHMVMKCKHGKVVRQCRCPSPDKTVRIVDCYDCPESPVREDDPTIKQTDLDN